MPKIIAADYTQQWLFPPTLEELLPQDHPARFVREFLQQLNLPALGFPTPPPGPGRPAFAPALLLAVWLYGHLTRIYSTRRLEAACLDQVGFLWLTGMHAPDHTTLWNFFHTHRKDVTALFRQIVLVAVDCDQVGLALQAVDGTKLAGACSRHTAWHRETLKKQLAQAAAAAAAAAEAAIDQAFAQEAEWETVRLTGVLAEATLRTETIQAALAALDAAEADHGSRTDPDARMMKLADGPCRLGYNAQAVVDSRAQVIVAIDVVTAPTDTEQLVPMLAQAEALLGAKPEVATADGGYLSGGQLTAAEAAGFPVLVNLGEDAQQEEVGPYHKSRFTYDPAQDVYRCPHGETLPFLREKPHTQRGYVMRLYRCVCKTCPVRGQCTRGKGPREIARLPHEEVLAQQRLAQASAENRALLSWRKAVVEPVFAQIKQHLHFRRFTVWGLPSVQAQWALVCSAYNLRVLYHRWRRGLCRLPAGMSMASTEKSGLTRGYTTG